MKRSYTPFHLTLEHFKAFRSKFIVVEGPNYLDEIWKSDKIIK